MKWFGGIEAGGTKFICMVAQDPEHILAEQRFTTTTPDETIPNVAEFFAPYAKRGELAAIGIASFGPLDLNRNSPTYGYITSTPKPGWSQFDFCGAIENRVKVPVAFDTDVNAAAIGEQYWVPENRSLDPFVYVTVGTGIGVGVIVNGTPIHGLMHAEAGHFALPHDWQRDPFEGVCPYHGDCLEGLASGLSLNQRWGQPSEELPDSHMAWDLETDYLALALVNLIYAYSPQRIVLGGGVSQQPGLLETIQCKVQREINGYLQSPWLSDRIDEYIVSPALGNRSGGLGAIAMARMLESGMPSSNIRR